MVTRSSLPVVLISVRADGLAWATLNRLAATSQLLGALRLFGDVGCSVLGVAAEVIWGEIPAQVTVKAGPIDVERAADIIG